MSTSWYLLLLGLLCLTQNTVSVSLGQGPPEDGLDWIDNTLVPEPSAEGARWWYAPSRKAPFFAEKYKKEMKRNFLKVDDEDLRLPKDVLPYIYSIRLLPFLDEDNFTTHGSIDIFVDCFNATQNITMNAAELTIDKDSIKVLDLSSQLELEVDNFSDDQETKETISIGLVNELEPGKKYKISVKFVAILNDDLQGFYRASYMENGTRKWLAISDFEAPNARRAFPCFDEPNMKAQFSITLGRKNSMRSASNMDILSVNPIDDMPGYSWDIYRTTPVKMPTYLVAFLVSEFAAVSALPGLSRVPFRIWTRPDYVNFTKYSLDVAPRIQQHFETLFQIPYALPKQDLAAIPEYAWGAMENWGLITYLENYLLLNPETASRTQFDIVTTINAHELAHQWFGNYVTLDWWNVLWLNEGFATYFEFFGTISVEPEWGMDDQFITSNLHYVFGPDGLETSRPMNNPVYTTDDMNNMFDSISYERGGCIVRMIADIVGEATFQRVSTRYLSDNAMKNVDEDNLWEAIQIQADIDGVILPATVKNIMETWTLQMGYPVINVTRNYGSNSALVSQERFLLRRSEESNDTHVYRWWVPLTYVREGAPLQRGSDWLSDSQDNKTITVNGVSDDEWIILNIGQQNYYRVMYDETNYGLIAKSLVKNHREIMIRNRAQILDDAFNLALAQSIPYGWALDLTQFLEFERDYVPWRSVLTELDYIDIMLFGTTTYLDWRSYMTRLVEPYYYHVGFYELELDPHLTIYSRTDALNWACRLQIPNCTRSAGQEYAALMAEPDLFISPNTRNQILRTGVEFGGRPEWNFAFDQYKATGSRAYLTAMTSTRDTSLIYDMLNLMLNGGIRRDDVRTLFSNLASTSVGNSIAFSFLINRWDDIEKALGRGDFVSFYTSLRFRLKTQDDLDKYVKLRDDHFDILGSSMNVALAIETVENNVKWVRNHLQEIGDWLRGINNPTVPTVPTTSTVPTSTSPTITDSTLPQSSAATEPTTQPSSSPVTSSSVTSSQATEPAGSSSQATEPTGTSTQATEPAGSSSQATEPAGTSSQATEPAGTSSQATEPAGTSSQATQPTPNPSTEETTEDTEPSSTNDPTSPDTKPTTDGGPTSTTPQFYLTIVLLSFLTHLLFAY